MARIEVSKAQHRKPGRVTEHRLNLDRILIVSEGKKTEPNYFKEIRKFYRLSTTRVKVHPSESGTAPLQVVEYAEQLFIKGDRNRNIPPRAFDQVFAVFDRDDHKSYFDALKKAELLDKKHKNDNKHLIRFRAIPSVPSFELWFLLHFEHIQTRSDRHEVFRRLKVHIPQYEKCFDKSFELTRHLLDTAYLQAEKLKQHNSPYSVPEPYTAVDDLVKLLTGLRT